MAGKKEQSPRGAARKAAPGKASESAKTPPRKTSAKTSAKRKRKESPLERKEWGYDPLLGLESIKTTMSGLLAELFTKRGGTASSELPWEPPIDLYEDDNQLVVEMPLPGAVKGDVQMHAYPNLLIISGETRNTGEIASDRYHFQERRWGAFHRSIPLPFTIRPESIRASMTDGILCVRMPLEGKRPGKSIQIKID